MIKFLLASTLLHLLFVLIFTFSSNLKSNNLAVQTGSPVELEFISKPFAKLKAKHVKVFKFKNAIKEQSKFARKKEVPMSVSADKLGVQQNLQVIGSLKPIYPRSSRKLREEGSTRVRLIVDASGNLVSYKVIQSSGYKRLDKAAIKSIQRAKFKPPINSQESSNSSHELVFNFELTNPNFTSTSL